MEVLLELQKIMISQFKISNLYHRAAFDRITLDNYITGIVGSRGVGKTTLLLYHAVLAGAEQHRALYLSADHLYFLTHSIFDLVGRLYKETDVRLLCIDEIHKYENWEQELKNIADTYSNIRILFSGSSAIDLIHGKYDLSRRVTLHHLHGFSFREHLEFSLGQSFPILKWDDFLKNHQMIARDLNIPDILKHFKYYLKCGYYPFFKMFKEDAEKFQAIEHIIQKTIYEDIGSFKSLKTSTLRLLEKIYQYVLTAPAGEWSTFKLANVLQKDFNSVSDYLALLEQAGLVHFVWSAKSGKAQLRNPEKVYPENTNLIYSSYLPQIEDNTIGRIRETFVVNQLKNSNISCYYSDVGDFEVQGSFLEVGGKNKTTKQIKEMSNSYLLIDNQLLGSDRKIPLYLIGFLG